MDVVASAVLLDTNAVSSGLTFENRLITELPTFSSMPMLLIRSVSGVAASAAPQFATQGFVGGPSDAGRPDRRRRRSGVHHRRRHEAGNNRNVATSPNSDMLQEMRIETSNFDASVGHGTGLGVSMMTKAGTNRCNGTAGYQTWTSRLNGANHFQKPILDTDPELKKVFQSGKSTNMSFTLGGPIVIPKLVDGRNKLFFFANYSFVADLIPGNIQGGAITIPTEAHLRGDFSDLLLLPNPQQYRIYDPLTARPDPNRPGRIIRDPFPNNIIPQNRIVNPAYKLYTQFLPAPNQNPPAGLAPTDNYLGAAEPDQTHSHLWGGRVDFNPSQSDRFFFRAAGSYFTEEDDDWTYENPLSEGLHATWRLRKSWSYTGNWTRVFGNGTVVDMQAASNWFLDSERRLGMKRYKPTEFGMPQYVDDFCSARQGGCQMPAVNIAGYQDFGGNVGVYPEVLNIQGQVNVTHVRGAHTLRVGSDNRSHGRKISNLGNTSGVVNYTNLYTRAADDTTVFPAGNLGLAWAAFMLGVPQSFSIDDFVAPELHSPYFSAYGQDTWRVGRKPDAQLRPSLRVRERYRRNRASRHHRLGSRRGHSHHGAGRSGLRGKPESEPPGEHVPGSRRADFRERFANERTLLEGRVAVDAATVGRLPARQPDGAQGRLRHVLRHAERGQLHAAHDRLQRDEHARDEQRLRTDLGAREPRRRDSSADRSVPAARRRHALRPDRWRQPRCRLVARQCRDDRQPGSEAPARAAVSRERPARAVGHVGHRGRLQLPGRRSAADDTPHGLPAGGVLERGQRQGRHAAELPADERAQPLPALALLLAPGDQPRPLRADGGQRLLHEPPPCS